MKRMNNPGLPPGGVVHLDQEMQRHAQQKMQFIQNRAQTAFTLLGNLLALEEHTPGLPRCRELVNLAFATGEYFNTQAIAPLKEDDKTIIKDV